LKNDGLLAADATIRTHPDLAHTLNLLVAHHGDIVFERCYRESRPADLHCAHSVTKSFVSTIVGILAGDGLVPLDAPVSSLVDAPALHADPIKAFWNVHLGRPDWRFHFLDLPKGGFLELLYDGDVLSSVTPHRPLGMEASPVAAGGNI